MVRQTSILSYKYLKEIGALGDRQVEVLNAFKSIGPATDREVSSHLLKADPNYVRPRRNELAEYGYLKEVERRKCKITGRRAIAWALA